MSDIVNFVIIYQLFYCINYILNNLTFQVNFKQNLYAFYVQIVLKCFMVKQIIK